MIFVEEQKTHPITMAHVQEAFKRVRANDGSAGVDKTTIAEVDANKRKYLYPFWNRLSSGCYFPNSVRQKLMDKGGGKKRALGIPTITDRVAQPNLKVLSISSSAGIRLGIARTNRHTMLLSNAASTVLNTVGWSTSTLKASSTTSTTGCS